MWDAKTGGGSEGLVDLAQTEWTVKIGVAPLSSANIFQVLHFCFQVGVLEPQTPDHGNLFELSMDDIECPMTIERLAFFTGNAQVLLTTLLCGTSHKDGLGNGFSLIASAF